MRQWQPKKEGFLARYLKIKNPLGTKKSGFGRIQEARTLFLEHIATA
jgi:hypothetical protein